MIISEIIYRLLPESLFAGLQQQYHKLKKAIYKPMSLDDFEDVLNKLNIRKGDVVFIHSSYDKLHLSFSVLQMLKTLQERVGPEGTLLFPSWSYAGRTEDYLKSNKPFDVRKSFTRMGLLPEVARRKKTAIRSFHPTAAIAAIGKHAEELTNTHHLSSYACDENSPYFKMMKYNAKIIGLGEKTNDPLQMYLSDIFTLSANLAGIPGLSLPCGFCENGLPIGLQMMAPHFAEARLLQAAYAFEQAAGICGQKPDLPAV
jgi:hypothetical protein